MKNCIRLHLAAATLWWVGSVGYGEIIDLPKAPPIKIPKGINRPPSPTRSNSKELEWRQDSDKRYENNSKGPTFVEQEKAKEKVQAEQKRLEEEKTPPFLAISQGFAIPVILGSKTHSNPDPTVLMQFGTSLYFEDDNSFWLNLRLAPFCGVAFMNNKSFRWCDSFFGPGVQYTRTMRPANEDATKKEKGAMRAGSEKEPPPNFNFSEFGAAMGFAAVSRETATDPALFLNDRAMQTTKGARFEGLGLWFESSYAFFPSRSYGFFGRLGIQMARKKNFVYGSLGIEGRL